MQFRFRLRSLLAAIVVFCLLITPIAWWRHRVVTQLNALDYLEARGARIFYAYQVKMIGGRHACDDYAVAPHGLLVRYDGIKGACAVAGVWCPKYRSSDGTSAQEIADNEMQILSSLHDLKFLVIDSSSISDDGTSVLGQIRHLEDIALNSPRITDVTVERLAKQNRLTAVSLVDTSVTDRGVMAMTHLQR
jgi:hypothetical protein